MGCTDCGRKGGCDSRKHGMFAAVDEALARLYPTRRWGERDEEVALGQGVSRDEIDDLAAAIAKRLNTLAFVRPGDPDEWCDYIYVLALGRAPSIVEIREGDAAAPDDLVESVGGYVGAESAGDAGGAESVDGDAGSIVPVDVVEDGGQGGLSERYLRVALSGLARFAGVQEVAMTMRRLGGDLVITESARGGVFDPVLLPRFQSLVAVLAQMDIRHLDFGEIVEPPPGFDAADYTARFGSDPVIANYLFYPQPPTTVSTVVLPGSVSSSA